MRATGRETSARSVGELAPAVARRGFRLGLDTHRVHVALLLTSAVAGTLFLLGAPRDLFEDDSSQRRAVAQRMVKQYAWESYPLWALANPHRTCPERISELAEYTSYNGTRDPIDPWGNEYRWACKDRFIMWSAGPDQTFGSDDDIGSGS